MLYDLKLRIKFEINFLVKHTLNEVLISSFLLFFSSLFDVAQKLIEVAGGGVHLFFFGVSKDFSDVFVSGLESETADKVTNLENKNFIKKMIW